MWLLAESMVHFPFRGMLGWQYNVNGIPLEQLSLRGLLPSPGREAVSQLMEYQQFRTNRGCNDASHKSSVKACIHLARFLYHDQSQVTIFVCAAAAAAAAV